MAHGSITFVCTGCLSLVLALAAAVHPVRLDGADYRLDSEHHPYLLRLASAHPGTTMVSSWLDHGTGIWSRGNGRRDYRIAPFRATDSLRIE